MDRCKLGAGAIFACDTSRSKHLCMSEHWAFKTNRREQGRRVFFHLLILRLDFHICLSSLMQVIHYRLGGVLLSTTCGHTSTTTNPSWVPSFHFHSSLTKSLEQVFPLTLLGETHFITWVSDLCKNVTNSLVCTLALTRSVWTPEKIPQNMCVYSTFCNYA